MQRTSIDRNKKVEKRIIQPDSANKLKVIPSVKFAASLFHTLVFFKSLASSTLQNHSYPPKTNQVKHKVAQKGSIDPVVVCFATSTKH